jgi:mono/diheme cytochrome c family protein
MSKLFVAAVGLGCIGAAGVVHAVRSHGAWPPSVVIDRGDRTPVLSADESMTRSGAPLGSRVEVVARPAPAVSAGQLLTPAEEKLFATGQMVYKGLCIGCHMENGRGQEKVAPSLVGSRFVIDSDASHAIRIVLGGKQGPTGLMPPLAAALSDVQIAGVLTYVRRSWGHTASAVSPDDVLELRAVTESRTTPWTDAELPAARRDRGAGSGPSDADGGAGRGQ